VEISPIEVLRQGVAAWNEWRKFHPEPGIDLSGEDLSELDLAGINLSEADLSGADLYQTDLSRSNLKLACLTGADLSGAKLEAADLYKCDFRDAFLPEANLNDAYLGAVRFCFADLRGATLVSANLTEADLRDAKLSGADLRTANLTRARIGRANLSHANFAGSLLVGLDYGPLPDMRRRYFGVRGLETSSGNAVFVREARDQDFLDTMEKHFEELPAGPLQTIRRVGFFMWGKIDFGRSLVSPILYAAALVFGFGCIYALDMNLGLGWFEFGGSSGSWLTPFYHSVVTYTTLGFGDITPRHWFGEMLVIIEVILGYTTLGLVLSILANKVARRS
jgi:hypothetical protein